MKLKNILRLLLIGLVLLAGCAEKPEVTVTAYFDELKTNITPDLKTIAKVFEWAFSGITEEEITTKSTSLFLDLATDIEKTYVKTIPVYMVKKDGKWLISGDVTNYEMIDALTGGVLEFAKKLEESTNESNG